MNKKIIDYTVLNDYHRISLIKKVLKKTSEGWTPQGGVSTKVVLGKEHFIQALVKHED